MTATTDFPPKLIEYAESDGLPMAESDQTREYLVYATKVLSVFFENQPDVYASGNLFIYYEQGNLRSCTCSNCWPNVPSASKLRTNSETLL